MENKLVKSYRQEIYADSRMIAEKFKKNHQNVLRKIDNLISALEKEVAQNGVTKNRSELIFKEKTRPYKGQDFRYVELNRSAFTILVMGFTGAGSLKWKLEFEYAFCQMEKTLLQQSNSEWLTVREHGKEIRLNLVDEIKIFVDYAMKQGSKSANKYYMNIEKKGLQFVKDLGIKKLPKSEQKKRYWLMKCLDCNKEFECEAQNVKNGIKSCRECGGKTHGLSGTRLYRIHSAMKQRCYNPKNTHFKYYGGKGITVCNEWKNNFMDFYSWAMNNNYTDFNEIDRINGNGNYNPVNCRWATKDTQLQNTKKYCNNTSGFRGVSLHAVSGLWNVSIQSHKKRVSLGYFSSPHEAALAYDQYVIDNNLEHTLNILKKPKMQYKALLLVEKNEKVSKDFRNMLNLMDLNHLIAAESVARKALITGMEQELHYKDCFQLAKKNVIDLANIMVIKKTKMIDN